MPAVIKINKQEFALKAFLKVDIGCVRRVTEPLCNMICVMYVDYLRFFCMVPCLHIIINTILR